MSDHDALFAYIFGSVVKATAHSNSDVDIAVYFANIAEGSKGDIQAVDKQINTALILEPIAKRPVDVVVLNRASIDLRQNILLHGRLLFCRDQAVHKHFKLQQLRDYQDFSMLEPIFRRYRKRRIQEGSFGGRSANRKKAIRHD